MRFSSIIQAAAAHLLIAAAVILATWPPPQSSDRVRVDRKIDPNYQKPTDTSPERQTPETPRFEVTVQQAGNRLRIAGTVFGGRPCRKMRLTLRLQQKSNIPFYHTVTVSGTGGPEPTSFRSERRIGGIEANPEEPWQAKVHSHRCVPENS